MISWFSVLAPSRAYEVTTQNRPKLHHKRSSLDEQERCKKLNENKLDIVLIKFMYSRGVLLDSMCLLDDVQVLIS